MPTTESGSNRRRRLLYYRLSLPDQDYIVGQMRMNRMKVMGVSTLAMLFGALAQAADLTAFDLIKEANRYVGEQAKDKVVQVVSEKSRGSMTPNVWVVTLYDPTAKLKATDVKFGAGKMLGVTRPMRLLEPVTRGDAPLEREKLKIDSDEAIKTALKEPLLDNLKVVATKLNLVRVGEGVLGVSGPGQAVWKVRLYALKLRDTTRDADIGEVWVSAFDGKVLKTDLHLNRVD